MQELWRSKCGAVRARERKMKGGKLFLKSGMKVMLRVKGESDQGGKNHLKWNGISSLLKIGGRMSRYGFCPIFINEKMSVV